MKYIYLLPKGKLIHHHHVHCINIFITHTQYLNVVNVFCQTKIKKFKCLPYASVHILERTILMRDFQKILLNCLRKCIWKLISFTIHKSILFEYEKMHNFAICILHTLELTSIEKSIYFQIFSRSICVPCYHVSTVAEQVRILLLLSRLLAGISMVETFKKKKKFSYHFKCIVKNDAILPIDRCHCPVPAKTSDIFCGQLMHSFRLPKSHTRSIPNVD